MGIVCCTGRTFIGESIEDHINALNEEEEKLAICLENNFDFEKSGCTHLLSPCCVIESSRVVCEKLRITLTLSILSQVDIHIREAFLNLSGAKRNKLEEVYISKLQTVWESYYTLKKTNYQEKVTIFSNIEFSRFFGHRQK